MSLEKSNFELINEFHQAFDNGYKDPEIQNRDRILLRGKLMLEELLEVFDELNLDITIYVDGPEPGFGVAHKLDPKPINKAKVAKELADLLYVTYGSGDTMDIPMDEVYREVHRSNMSKLGADGKPVRREDGKVLKGPNYSPADIESVLKVKS
jgi:predicted HAD superfamily Cof-like phosphohydrolase